MEIKNNWYLKYKYVLFKEVILDLNILLSNLHNNAQLSIQKID